MTQDDLINKLDTHGLYSIFNKLKPQIRDTIRLYPIAEDDKDIRIGATKIGGRPDLPKEQYWPTETRVKREKKFWFFSTSKTESITKSLSFIAQLNLEEISVFDDEKLLPKKGILYFFYAAEQDAWGFDYKDKDKFKVIFYEGNSTELKRVDFPEDLEEHARYKASSVLVKEEISLPYYENAAYESLTERESDIFWDKILEEGNINKILGYSDNIQHDMEWECELVTNGFYCGDAKAFKTSEAKKLQPNAANWVLLLQIDSNEQNDMMWGDSGRLYFWIRKEDLKNKRFDNAWMILQCF